jgi:hypothetical protein
MERIEEDLLGGSYFLMKADDCPVDRNFTEKKIDFQIQRYNSLIAGRGEVFQDRVVLRDLFVSWDDPGPPVSL